MTLAAEARRMMRDSMPLLQQPGIIGVVAAGRTTCPECAASLTAVNAPAGSQARWFTGGNSIAAARNTLASAALDAGAAWLWFVDDDLVFAPDSLARLLAHDVDIVGPLVARRSPPHRSIVYEDFAVPPTASDADLAALLGASRMPERVTPNGLQRAGVAGTAGLLIAARVFERMPRPWFEAGRLVADEIGEDVWFCLKARRAGIAIHIDPGVQLGHVASATVWPTVSAAGEIAHRVTVGAIAQEHR